MARRFVSAVRVPFEFYVSEKMKDIVSYAKTDVLIKLCEDHYKVALENGVKPQEARRIIPQAGYTQIWGAFQPSQLKNYLELRLDKASQWEIQQTALAMLKANS